MASTDRPAKRAKLLSDTESFSDEEEPVSGVDGGLKVNQEYARRFEHNKKREEKEKLEEKYGKASSDDSSSDETEDDDAELATKDLDGEIEETLAAIKRKDPRVYDKEVKFYQEFDPDTQEVVGKKKDKPMSLQDYHRRNLLERFAGDEQDEAQAGAPRTFAQEQVDLKRDVVGHMHANGTNGEVSDDGDDDDFLVAKRHPTRNEIFAQLPSKEITDADVAAADKDPETFLSNFMAARAWLPTTNSRLPALESDESEDDRRADEFEAAYNLRFEDPEHANEKLKTFARDATKYSVRREDEKGRARKRARDREKEKKDQEKRERQEEKKRLRDLRVEEMAAKVNKIREAAGLRGKQVNIDEWRDVLEGDFDDNRWEDEMRDRFGESYYADEEDENAFGEQEDQVEERPSKKRKPKKPTWDDDIDIKDLVPEFEMEETAKPAFTLSSDDEANDEEDGGVPVAPDNAEDSDIPLDAEAEEVPSAKRRSKKDFAKEKADGRRAARMERRKIEEIVDSNLPLEHPSLAASTKSQPVAGFRYRETSPTSFGLTARDILFADDTQLNQYAGLKKMAAFRDVEKKRRDKKRYSKKGRLREWRKETFGTKDEPSGGFERLLGRRPGLQQNEVPAEVPVDGTKAKKRKRAKNKKQQETSA